MSRNLGRTDCYFCQGEVSLKEVPRDIRKDEAFVYFDEYEGMQVANTECVDCEAKYLAWVKPPVHWGRWNNYRDGAFPFFDLSFRSTFNDEWGEADVPTYEIEVIRRRKGPWKI